MVRAAHGPAERNGSARIGSCLPDGGLTLGTATAGPSRKGRNRSPDQVSLWGKHVVTGPVYCLARGRWVSIAAAETRNSQLYLKAKLAVVECPGCAGEPRPRSRSPCQVRGQSPVYTEAATCTRARGTEPQCVRTTDAALVPTSSLTHAPAHPRHRPKLRPQIYRRGGSRHAALPMLSKVLSSEPI